MALTDPDPAQPVEPRGSAGLTRAAVVAGALTHLAIALPPVLIVRALTQDDEGARSWLPVVATVIALLVAPAVGGAVAAHRSATRALAHGAAAGALAWAALGVTTLVRLVATSRGIGGALLTILTFAPIEIGVATIGAFARTSRTREVDPS